MAVETRTWGVETEWDSEGVKVRILSPEGDGAEATLTPERARSVGHDLIAAAQSAEEAADGS